MMVITRDMDANFRAISAFSIVASRSHVTDVKWKGDSATFDEWWTNISRCKTLPQWRDKAISLGGYPDGHPKKQEFEDSIKACSSKAKLLWHALQLADMETFKLIPLENRR